MTATMTRPKAEIDFSFPFDTDGAGLCVQLGMHTGWNSTTFPIRGYLCHEEIKRHFDMRGATKGTLRLSNKPNRWSWPIKREPRSGIIRVFSPFGGGSGECWRDFQVSTAFGRLWDHIPNNTILHAWIEID